MEMLFDDTDEIDRVVQELWRAPNWPKDPVKDRSLVAELQQQFPGVDLVDEIGKFRVWLIGLDDARKVVTSRGRHQRIRNWVAKEGRRVVPTRRAGTGRARPCRTSARPAAAFGSESSTVLTGW